MNNNSTKTEMVAEMKSSYKHENAGEGRSLSQGETQEEENVT